MNYYNEIKKELINNEIYKKVKDYSKNRNDLNTYYNVGKLIIEAQGGEERAKYGDNLIKEYSKKLTKDFNYRFNSRILWRSRKFYLLFSKELSFSKDNIYGAISTFIEFAAIALILNIGVYQSGILNGETFDMFYISPYFPKDLPVFKQLFDLLPYPVYLISYLIILSIGGVVVYSVTKFIRKKVMK